MSFEHLEMNKLFGFDSQHEIPFVCINNPLGLLANAKKILKESNTSDATKKKILNDLK